MRTFITLWMGDLYSQVKTNKGWTRQMSDSLHMNRKDLNKTLKTDGTCTLFRFVQVHMAFARLVPEEQFLEYWNRLGLKLYKFAEAEGEYYKKV